MDYESYHTGWNDCNAYRRENHRLKQNVAGFGASLFLLGCILSLVAVSIILVDALSVSGLHIVRYAPLIWINVVGLVMIVSGYFLNKRAGLRYEKLEQDFNTKWQTRWENLGVMTHDL